ncbi:MAG: hypothetical protein AAFW89_02175 [Bacteroidota bacterium]
MRTTIDLPDELVKAAKIKAIEEGISLKQLFIRSLERELSNTSAGTFAGKDNPAGRPWEQLRGKGTTTGLKAATSGFEDPNEDRS